MLRRLSVIAATAVMLALSALPALATTHSSTHKLAFPRHSGISSWGTYKKTSRGIYVNICVKNTGSSFAAGAVAVGTNASGSRSANLGAVVLGRGTQCRFGTIRYSSHLKTYIVTWNNHGQVSYKSGYKKIF